MIKINMQEEGFDFEDLVSKLKNPRPLLVEVAGVIKADITERITTTKVDPDGNPWEPWAQSTATRRARDGSWARGLLWNSGALLDSLVEKIEPKRAVVTATAPYAGFLQYGTRNMPARPFVGISQQANEDIIDLVNEYLDS